MQSLFDLPPGSIIAGDFRILSSLTPGFLKSSYVAEQASTGSIRMLTLLHPQLVYDPTSRQRFEQEARLAAQIRSENAIHIVGAGIDAPTQVGWLATELLDGRDLASYVERRGALPFTEVCEIFAQLGHGLSAAHAMGLVHRDLT